MDASLPALLLRLVLSLAVVLGVMALAARLLRRTGGGAVVRGGGGPRIDVVARRSLGRRASVAVVRVGGQAYLLGVTDASVRVLGRPPLDAAEPAELDPLPAGRTPAIDGWLTALRDRTVRR